MKTILVKVLVIRSSFLLVAALHHQQPHQQRIAHVNDVTGVDGVDGIDAQATPPVTPPRGPFSDFCDTIVAIAWAPDPEYKPNSNGRDLSDLEGDADDADDTDETFICNTASSTGETIELEGTPAQIAQLRHELNYGEFVSGEYAFDMPGNFELRNGGSGGNGRKDEKLVLPSGMIKLKKVERGKSGDSNGVGNGIHRRLRSHSQLTPEQLSQLSHQQRRHLANLEGQKRLLAVRVTDSNGEAYPDDAATMSDNIFGTYGDPVNLRTQMFACSMGKLNITYDYNDYTQTPEGMPPAWIDQLSAPGVLEVNITVSLNNTRSTVKNAVTAAVKEKLNITSLPGPFENVMYILARCVQSCGWAAYATVNGWNSVYQKQYYKFTGVQMHELGHNFDLAHSGGLNGQTYTDHTCLMGNPLYSDDVGKMCFNPAKNYQISNGGVRNSENLHFWYTDSPTTDTPTWEPDISTSTTWSGQIIGLADYQHDNKNDRPIVLKIESGTAGGDLFVGFNRAAGITADNDEADDEVTVVNTAKDGLGYSQSYLRATLVAGEMYVASNFKGDGNELRIWVESIDQVADPWFADVRMEFSAPPTTSPTSSPTNAPTISPTTAQPTASPTKNPTTSPTRNPTLSPTVSPTASPTKSPTISPTKNPSVSPTMAPSKSPTMSPTKNPTGSPTTAQPSSSPTTAQPSSSPTTAQPTISPTKNPTVSPTKNPTTSPTASPTKNPTVSPTKNPTSSPTKNPTISPTKNPTLSPSSSPSKNPTTSPSKNPTGAPTTAQPTTNPTSSPTLPPTISPTSSPTSSPVSSPTLSPTTSPTQSPSSAPTSSPTFCVNIPVATNNNGICEPGEHCQNSGDCEGKEKGKDTGKYCCYGGTTAPLLEITYTVDCSDSRCGTACVPDDGTPVNYCCGNGVCEDSTGETLENCPQDCGVQGPPPSPPPPPPTKSPTTSPSKQPTTSPTNSPTLSPTLSPSRSPTGTPTMAPTRNPTLSPTNNPTKSPSLSPTKNPTVSPTVPPTQQPTSPPVANFSPTSSPTISPTKNPTTSPTSSPTKNPTTSPSKSPTTSPTTSPTKNPTTSPTNNPTKSPTISPTKNPTASPTTSPTKSPTISPILPPTSPPVATPLPTPQPTPRPVASCETCGNNDICCAPQQCETKGKPTDRACV